MAARTRLALQILIFFRTSISVALDAECKSEDECLDEPPHTSLLQLQMRNLKQYAQRYSKPKYFWSGKNGDDLRTGASDYTVDLNVLKATPAWSFIDGDHGVVRAAPLIDDKTNIYLATVQDSEALSTSVGRVRKFSPDGKILWNYTDTSRIADVPSLYDGMIFFTNMQGLVTALDMDTGREVWRKSALVDKAKGSASDTWSMTAGDGIIISAVSSGQFNDYIVALAAATGEVKWSFQPDNFVYNSLVALKDGSLVFSDNTGKAYRLDLKTGHQIWKVGPARRGETIQTAMSTGGTVLSSNGFAYVTSNAYVAGQKTGFITAFNFSNGNFLWRKSTNYEANNGAVVGNIGGRLAVAIGVGGNPDMPNGSLQSKHVADNASFLPEKKARILALDAETGKSIWSHELPAWHGWGAGETMQHVCLPDSFGNAAIGSDGTVFVGFQSGHLIGISDKDANGKISPEEIAEFDTGRCVQGTPAIAPGMLAFTPCNGLYVFKE